MRLLAWLLRAFIFFALFAFALNNQHTATVHWFFGVKWQTPLVIVVLAAFAAGCAVGVVAMLPDWWRRRRLARLQSPPSPPPPTAAPSVLPSGYGTADPPPRTGL